MTRSPYGCTALLMLLAFLLAGCEAIPTSQHPLSDETDSQIDKRLLGMWQLIPEEEPAADSKQPAAASTEQPNPPAVEEERPPQFAIGRLAGKARTLEFATLKLNEEQQIEVQRAPFFTTRVGDLWIASLQADDRPDSDYLILRYELVNANRIQLYLLDREFISAAIASGELKGIVKKAAAADPNDAPRRQAIRITAAPRELRDFLAKHEKKAFTAKSEGRLQRAAAN